MSRECIIGGDKVLDLESNVRALYGAGTNPEMETVFCDLTEKIDQNLHDKPKIEDDDLSTTLDAAIAQGFGFFKPQLRQLQQGLTIVAIRWGITQQAVAAVKAAVLLGDEKQAAFATDCNVRAGNPEALELIAKFSPVSRKSALQSAYVNMQLLGQSDVVGDVMKSVKLTGIPLDRAAVRIVADACLKMDCEDPNLSYLFAALLGNEHAREWLEEEWKLKISRKRSSDTDRKFLAGNLERDGAMQQWMDDFDAAANRREANWEKKRLK
jgi:hypothetical protein